MADTIQSQHTFPAISPRSPIQIHVYHHHFHEFMKKIIYQTRNTLDCDQCDYSSHILSHMPAKLLSIS